MMSHEEHLEERFRAVGETASQYIAEADRRTPKQALTTLPGYFHRVDHSDRKRPLLIIHSGFDGSAQEVHVDGARAAVERGYNVLAFDGPGQFGPLHREGLTFRPDWERVVTPVVDFASKLPGVNPKRIALMGISLGGELAPRAAAFDNRPISSEKCASHYQPLPTHAGPDITSHHQHQLALHHLKLRFWHI
jgi:dienelactone hydrolase